MGRKKKGKTILVDWRKGRARVGCGFAAGMMDGTNRIKQVKMVIREWSQQHGRMMERVEYVDGTVDWIDYKPVGNGYLPGMNGYGRGYNQGGYQGYVAPKAKVDVPELRMEVEMERVKGVMVLKEDGKWWRKWNVWGGEFEGRMTEKEVAMAMVGTDGWKDEKDLDEGLMLKSPEEEWRLPPGLLKLWAGVMLTRPGEMGVVYGKRVKDGKWVAMVPPQEATGGNVDMEKLDEAQLWMAKEGFVRVGTIHTHPGGMTGFSGTDKADLFTKVGGIQFIVPRDGKVGAYVSLRGVVWKLDWGQEVSMWGTEKVDDKGGWDKDGFAVGFRKVDGSGVKLEDLDVLVQKPKYGVVSTYVAPARKDWGRDARVYNWATKAWVDEEEVEEWTDRDGVVHKGGASIGFRQGVEIRPDVDGYMEGYMEGAEYDYGDRPGGLGGEFGNQAKKILGDSVGDMIWDVAYMVGRIRNRIQSYKLEVKNEPKSRIWWGIDSLERVMKELVALKK
jgi:hypothetical protein